MPPRNVKGWKHLLVSQCNMTGAIGYSSVTSRGRHTLLQRERHTHGGTYFIREAGNSLFCGEVGLFSIPSLQILKGAIPFVSQPCSLRQSKNIFTPILLQNLISEEEV